MRILKGKIAWAFCLLVTISLSLPVLPALGGEYKVSRVVDGDTIKVRGIPVK